tara:strand:- start:446 stop:769 length:324 start_codon:yes stop_codon:yes gene_type:complete
MTQEELMIQKLAGKAAVVDFLEPMNELQDLVTKLSEKQMSKLNVSKEEKTVLANYKEELNTQVKNLMHMAYSVAHEIDVDINHMTANLDSLKRKFEFKLYIIKKDKS